MTFASRLVDRIAARLGDDTRRGFLTKSAVVGAALATTPVSYILRPGTAYAAVCGGGAGCGSGWTVFCCTVNDGANTCPPGTFAAGWWKADSSSFCGGTARYYIDCNRLPSQPGACSCVGCHSGNGTCDQRRYCCNVFRYGQCHLEIPGVTPVVCRVITCTPPWQWDPACGTSARTDNRTGSHTAPCLPGPGASAITIKYQDLGMTGSPLGRQTGIEEDAAGGGRRVLFEHGSIHWRAGLGAWGGWGPIHEAWIGERGGPTGSPGHPRGDTKAGPNGGQFQLFEGGTLYWSEGTGARAVWGGILEAYNRAGGPSTLGYPLADEEPGPLDSRQSRFENGVITWRADLGAHAIFGGIRERWDELGPAAAGLPWNDAVLVGGRGFEQGFTNGMAIFGATDVGAFEVPEPALTRYRRAGGPGGGLGFPTAAPLAAGRAWISRFDGGTIVSEPDLGTHAVFGSIHARWQELGGHEPDGIGLPWTGELGVGDRRGRVQWFTRGAIYWSSATGAHDVAEPILSHYRGGGGPGGPLGDPVAGTEQVSGGGTRSRFERGTLVADRAGRVTQQ